MGGASAIIIAAIIVKARAPVGRKAIVIIARVRRPLHKARLVVEGPAEFALIDIRLLPQALIAGGIEEILHGFVIDRVSLLRRARFFQTRRLLEPLLTPDSLFQRLPLPRLKPGERPPAPLDIPLLAHMAAGERFVLQPVPLLRIAMRRFLNLPAQSRSVRWALLRSRRRQKAS
jgi:hypothetical protein